MKYKDSFLSALREGRDQNSECAHGEERAHLFLSSWKIFRRRRTKVFGFFFNNWEVPGQLSVVKFPVHVGCAACRPETQDSHEHSRVRVHSGLPPSFSLKKISAVMFMCLF